MKNAGKACNNRLYRHIRTFEKIVKNYFVISYKTVYPWEDTVAIRTVLGKFTFNQLTAIRFR